MKIGFITLGPELAHLLQTMKTQMKCHKLRISSGSSMFIKVKKIFRQKKYNIFILNYNLISHRNVQIPSPVLLYHFVEIDIQSFSSFR